MWRASIRGTFSRLGGARAFRALLQEDMKMSILEIRRIMEEYREMAEEEKDEEVA